jgi:cobalt-zinc-cadmium efflux system outer membrane protein
MKCERGANPISTPTGSRRTGILVAYFAILLCPAIAAANERPAEPTGELTFQKVLSIVLEDSPNLAASASDVRAAEARGRYGGLWANPTLIIQLEDALGTKWFRGFSESQTTFQLGQVFELGGKVKKRRAVAVGGAKNAKHDYERERATVLSEAALRFAHLLGDQHRLLLAREATQLSRDALAAAQKRVASGAASDVEERRARIILARSRIDEEHAEHELLASRRILAALWGSTAPKFKAAVGELFVRAPLPKFADVSGRIAESPELRRLDSEKELRDAEIALAEARARPNLRLGAGARWLAGPDAVAFVANAAVPLPFANRNQGEIQATRAQREGLAHETEGARVRLIAELFALYQELAHVLVALDVLEQEVLPEAAAAMQTIARGFKLGRRSQLELLDAQRTLIEVRREHIDAAEEYHRFVVRMERLIGGPLAGAPKEQERMQ